jgi:hypothetical protein
MSWINWLIIGILVIAVIVIFIKILLRHLKKKLIDTAINEGANLITKTTGNILSEKAASQVSEITNVTAQALKSGSKTGFIKFAAKKGLEAVKNAEDKDKKDKECTNE